MDECLKAIITEVIFQNNVNKFELHLLLHKQSLVPKLA